MNIILTQAGSSSAGGSFVMIGIYVLIFIGVFVGIHLISKKKKNAKIPRVCPKCGYYNYGKIIFCENCMTELPSIGTSTKKNEKKICPNCGCKTDKNNAFCPKCGNNI